VTLRMTWSQTFLDVLKDNEVKLVTYVPDNVLTPLIKGVVEDQYFTSLVATREDEAIGIVTGAWMGGVRGCVLMQTSGFGVTPNALASLVVPFQIPAVLVVSERGTMGEFKPGARTLMVPRGYEDQDVVLVGHCTTCEAKFYRGQEDDWQRHVGRCAREHLGEIMAAREEHKKRMAIFQEESWDPEWAAHQRKVGKRMLAEGRLVAKPAPDLVRLGVDVDVERVPVRGFANVHRQPETISLMSLKSSADTAMLPCACTSPAPAPEALSGSSPMKARVCRLKTCTPAFAATPTTAAPTPAETEIRLSEEAAPTTMLPATSVVTPESM